jgi:osmotically inducible lipoprotein OsmB
VERPSARGLTGTPGPRGACLRRTARPSLGRMDVLRGALLATILGALGGCGADIADRGITGAAIGAGGAAIAGGSPLVGGIVGGAAGVLTNPAVIDLGRPPWRR